jgi:hypothetical protein
MNDVAHELETVLAVVDRLRQIDERTAGEKPAPDKWSRKEILGHLVDSAANNHQRFVRLQLQPSLELPGYEQDGWVSVQKYQEVPWADLINLWHVYNRHLAHIIRNANPAKLGNTWRDPEGKTVDLRFIMRDYITHMRGHLEQIL